MVGVGGQGFLKKRMTTQWWHQGVEVQAAHQILLHWSTHSVELFLLPLLPLLPQAILRGHAVVLALRSTTLPKWCQEEAKKEKRESQRRKRKWLVQRATQAKKARGTSRVVVVEMEKKKCRLRSVEGSEGHAG